MKRKILSILLVLAMLLGIGSLTGCGKVEVETNTTEIGENGYFFIKPESFNDCYDISIYFRNEINETIVISPVNDNLNYSSYIEGEMAYSREGIPLSNFPDLKEYIMSSEVQDKLQEGTVSTDKYQISFSVVGGGSGYSTNELDNIFVELRNVLKIGDTSIYGELSNKLEQVSTVVDNLEYDVLVQRNIKREKTISYSTSDWYDWTFINSSKMEKYTMDYLDESMEDNKLGRKDQLHIVIEKIDENELQEYISEYGKEDNLLKMKSIINEDITQEYRLAITEKM